MDRNHGENPPAPPKGEVEASVKHMHKEGGPEPHEHGKSKTPTKKKATKEDYMRTMKFMAGPMLGILVGAFIGTRFSFSPKVVTGLKSLAAGIVLAAVSTELIPEIADVDIAKERLWVVFGVCFGAIMLMTLRSYFDKYDATKEGKGKVPWEMIIAIAIDFFVDAILIGMAISLNSGAEGGAGVIMAVALGTEMLIVTMTAAAQMKENQVSKAEAWGIAAGLAGVVLLGGLLGNFVAARFKGSPPYYGLLAFGVSALIWLIFEELLVETSKNALDSRIQASLLFLGFLGIIASGWIGHAH